MSLTRKMLKGMGLSEDQIDTIIEAHTETTDALKGQRDKYKDDAEKLVEVQRELEEAREKLTNTENDDWKAKHDHVKKEFDDYKTQIANNKTREAKVAAYKGLLADAGLKGDKLIDTVLRSVDLDAIEMEDGAIKDSADMLESIKSEWKDYISAEVTRGASVPVPPSNTGGTMTREDIMAIKDRGERQKAIADNINLFTEE